MDDQKSQNLAPGFRYKIVEELGAGGMGRVYKAFDPNMNKFIALKVIATENASNKLVQRFTREAKAMAKMNHPNIVKVYSTGEQQNSPYFTMEYIEGGTLGDFLKSARLNVRLFSQIMVKIAKAIEYAHQMGIIHRDLKPSNILFNKDYEPYVMDFGLVKLVQTDESLSSKGAILGTPQYMSPQQARGEKVNHLTDVYSLGAIFYEMLAGFPLVQADNPTNIIYKVIHQEPTPLRKTNNKLIVDLETICHTALAKQTNKRYQSAKEFSEDIERFLCGEFIKAKAPGLWEKTKSICKRNKLLALVAIIGVLSIALAIWLFKNYPNMEVYNYLHQAEKLQQKANLQKTMEQQMQVYLKTSTLLEKALEISTNNFVIKNRLIKVKEAMGILAKKQKNYLLSFILFKQCKTLGYSQANALLKELEEEKTQLKEKHRAFITKTMRNISKSIMLQNALLDRYAFAIIKMQKPYVVEMLAPYLQKNNKNQRLLVIKTFAKLGNKHTKFQNKDTVQWLLSHLQTFKDKRAVLDNQAEVEEVIWALGWLKDARANQLVYKKRYLAGETSLLWIRTKVPYKWIPLKKQLGESTAQTFLVRGHMKLEKEDYSGAIADYSKAVSISPKEPRCYNNRGNAYAQLKKYDLAIADFSKAIALNRNYLAGYSNRGNTYALIKKYSLAIADFNRAITLNPDASGGYVNRGNMYARLQEYSLAIADFTKVIALYPKHVNAYYNRANAYRMLRKNYQAIADYSKTISLDPRSAKAHDNRGLCYQAVKEYFKAIADHSKAIVLHPKFAHAYNNRGLAYKNIRDAAKALADFGKAIALNPKYEKAYYNRGVMYMLLRRPYKAIADYSKGIAVRPNPFVYYNRATVYSQVRKFGLAMADYSKAIALNSRYKEAYANRAALYIFLKQYQKAYQDFQSYLKLDSYSPVARKIRQDMNRLRARGLVK